MYLGFLEVTWHRGGLGFPHMSLFSLSCPHGGLIHADVIEASPHRLQADHLRPLRQLGQPSIRLGILIEC